MHIKVTNRFPWLPVLAGLIGIIILSCHEAGQPSEEIELTEISIGENCGWCVFGDSLHLTPDDLYYRNFNPCNQEINYFVDTLTLPAEWEELANLLDVNDFRDINLNSCDVCVDGCDTWVIVKVASFTHRIQYGGNDSAKIEPIRLFLDKLNVIRERYRK
jgi:hypothetical protein